MPRRLLSILLVVTSAVSITGLTRARDPGQGHQLEALVFVPAGDFESFWRFGSTGLPLFARIAGQEGGLITGAGRSGLVALANAGLRYRILDEDTPGSAYYLVYPLPGHAAARWEVFGQVLLETSAALLLRIPPGQAARLAGSGFEIQALSLTPKPVPVPVQHTLWPEVLSPDPAIQLMIELVDESAVYSYTGGLSGEWPVTVGGQPYSIFSRNTYSGEPISRATQYVGEHLQNLGLNVEYHVWDSLRPPNVIGELTGTASADEIFLVTAHLDDMPASGPAPGADDNASGSVAVLVAADILAHFSWDCTLRFVFFTGEEQGLLGSHAYAMRSYTVGEDIRGVLNLDMIAWNSRGSAPVIELHADSAITSTLGLAQLFADVVDAYGLSLVPQIDQDGIRASDHASFWDYGYPAVLAIEDLADFNPNYHTVNDTLGNLEDLPYYTEFIRAAVGTFGHMSGCLVPPALGTLSGTITDSTTGHPIPGARLTAQRPTEPDFWSLTDPAGAYTRTLPVGVYTVTAAASGYLSKTISGQQILTDTVSALDFDLEPEPCAPVTGTSILWNPDPPTAGFPVVFTAANNDPGELSFSWDFGDGTIGTGITATHTYNYPGEFSVQLTTSSQCAAETITRTLQVQPPWIVFLAFAPVGSDPPYGKNRTSMLR